MMKTIKNFIEYIAQVIKFVVKLKTNLAKLKQVFTDVSNFILSLKKFIKKYKELLETEAKEDFKKLVKDADTITESLADVADDLNLKDISKKLRDIIKL